MRKLSFLVLLSLGVAMTSCNKETPGCTDETASNYDADATEDDGSCTYAITAPATYVFLDADGNSTVSYSGQHQRLNMLSEMVTYMKSANTPGTAIDASTLLAMYANEGYTWNDDENLGMTGSSKQLKNKTAGGDPAVTDMFEGWMTDLAAASATTTAEAYDGAAGVTGVVQSTISSSAYLQNGTGQEWVQLIEKGLMGACFHYNISSVYLGPGKMDVDNTTPEDPAGGKYYTEMEHHWDEAYGYFTTAVNYPEEGIDRFLGKYAWGREDPLESATNIGNAFRLGRAAISAGDMDLRDAQIDIIRHELELMIGGTAIHYFNSGVTNIADDAKRNHALSEAMAFTMGLAYADNPTVSQADVDNVLAALGSDFYTVTPAAMIEARDMLADMLGLTEYANQL